MTEQPDPWKARIIVDDPRIDDESARVRAAAERIHGNDSIHRHHDLDKKVCVYCALVASHAVRAIDALAAPVFPEVLDLGEEGDAWAVAGEVDRRTALAAVVAPRRRPVDVRRMTIDVKRATPADLTWAFRDGVPRYHHDASDGTVVDPFPCYPHDVDVVTQVAEVCAAAFPPAWPVTYHVAEFEDVARTNGWSAYAYTYDEAEAKWVPGHGHVFLSGKRVPPHPAVTRYVTAHEYGHQVQWFLEQQRGIFGERELITEYARMRGIEPVERYGGGVWHRHVEEVFACDFRVWVLGIEEDYWPHDGIDHPCRGQATQPVRTWWANVQLDIAASEPA